MRADEAAKVGAFQPGSQGRGISVRGHCLGKDPAPLELAGQRVQGKVVRGREEGWAGCPGTVVPEVILRKEVNSDKIVSTHNFKH